MRGSVPSFSALPASHPRTDPLGALVGPSGRSPGPRCPELLLGRHPSPVTCSLAPGCDARSQLCGRQRAPLVQESGTRQGRERRLGREALQVYPVLKENKIFSWENFPLCFSFSSFLLVCPFLLGCLLGSVPCLCSQGLPYPGSPGFHCESSPWALAWHAPARHLCSPKPHPRARGRAEDGRLATGPR